MNLKSGFGVVLLLCGAWLPSAHSGEPGDWHLVVHVRSWHASQPEGAPWNEANWGLGVRRDLSADWSVQAGAFRNSLKKHSAYAVADWAPWRHGAWSLGGSAGLIAGGYEEAYKPAVGVFGRVQLGDVGATLRLFPKPPPNPRVDLHRTALASLEFTWQWR